MCKARVKREEKTMKAKSLLITLFIILISFSFLNAEVKEGKFLGGKDVKIPSWFMMSSFLDLKEDVTELATQNKRLIVFIHQPNCPYCHRFVTKNLEDQATKQKKILKNFAIVDINMFGSKEVTDVGGEVYTEKEFQRYLTQRANKTRAKGEDVNIWD